MSSPFGRLIITAALLSLLMPADGAPPSEALREKLASLLKPEFDHFAWSPMFFAEVGLIHDNRPEPCRLEIAELQKRLPNAPNDAMGRHRLGWLLNRHGPGGSGDRWINEAAEICRRKLRASPKDIRALADLAVVLAGTEEAEVAAREAISIEKTSWRAWDALATHQLRKLQQRVLGNMHITPQEMAAADFPRLERALRAHAVDPVFSEAIFRLNAEREVSNQTAAELAPEELQPLLHQIASRFDAAVIVNTLHRLRQEPGPDRNAFDKESQRLLKLAVSLAQEDPAVLAALAFIQIQTITAMADLAAARTARSPGRAERMRFTNQTLPALPHLRELSQATVTVRAAIALEGYAGLLALMAINGAEAPEEPDLHGLLEDAVTKFPQRPLLWDLLLGLHFSERGTGPPLTREDALGIAQRRLRQIPDARSHAMIAYASTGEEARASWLKAVTKDPRNIEYMLNLAVATLAVSQSSENVNSAITLVQQATALSHDDFSWRKSRLEAFRLRTYAVCLILKGETERALALLIERIKEFPDDTSSRAIRDALLSHP